MTSLGRSDLDVFPLCLGGNVFGWTADEEASFAVLDAYAAAGGNFIDTAAGYSAWVPGNSGGESETIIGNWTSARGTHDAMVVATKVGHGRDLRRDVILDGAKHSLERLQTDTIDLYYMHQDDPETPFEESLGAFGELIRDGSVRYIGASNFTAERLTEALDVAEREGLPAIVALQNEYNLVARGYEHGPAQVVEDRGLGAVPYYGLASGFLTGKYRPDGAVVDSPRAQSAPSPGSTSTGSPCSRRSTRSRPSMRRRRLRSRSHGWPRSRPSWRRSPPRAAPSNCRSCSRSPRSICARTSSADSAARVDAVHPPVACDPGQPAAVGGGDQREAADHALASLVVAVEEVERDPLARGEGVVETGTHLVAAITQRPLPEADAAGGDIEIPLLEPQAPDVGGLRGDDMRWRQPPGVEDGDSGADVAQREDKIEVVVVELDRGHAGSDRRHVTISERHGQVRIGCARGREERSLAQKQRLLGDPRATVGCAHG